jgi:hypothetical protein
MGKTERRGGLAVYDHLELGRKLHRERTQHLRHNVEGVTGTYVQRGDAYVQQGDAILHTPGEKWARPFSFRIAPLA